MFMAPQIRAFILKVFFGNMIVIGKKYFSINRVCNWVSGNFICLMTAALQLGLEAHALNDGYSQPKFRGMVSSYSTSEYF